MNNRTPLIASFAIVAAMIAASIWAWLYLPDGAHVPIHWNVDGAPDRFAPGPIGLFMAPAMTALIALLFAVIPRLEPRRLNLATSAKFYHAAWVGTVVLLAVVHGIALYATLHKGAPVGNVVLGSVSLLMVVIGNYFGKTRSNFFAGVRTPWTLSSDYSWQQTHNLAGKLFIAAGAVGFAAAIGAPAKTASHIFLVAIAAAVVLSVAMSYVFWLRDPERRGNGAAPQ